MQFFIPPQIKRLVVAFAIFISAFIILRHILIPKSFGQYGFYRGASLEDIASIPTKFAGQKACLECHQKTDSLIQLDVHSGISCETCHGPGQKHCADGGKTLLDKTMNRESCGLCHSKNAAKQRNTVFQVDLKEHNNKKNCIECHNPHQPWSMKEQNQQGENLSDRQR